MGTTVERSAGGGSGAVAGTPATGGVPAGLAGDAPAGAAQLDANFAYRGGWVLNSPDVFLSFWGGSWGDKAHATPRANLIQYIQDLVASDYMNILSQYGVGQGAGRAGTYRGASALTTATGDLTGAGVEAGIQSLIDGGVVPEPGNPSSMALLVFMDESIRINDPGRRLVLCEPAGDTAFGYHSFFTTSAGNRCHYAVIPAVTDTCVRSSCPSGGCSLQLSQTQEQRRTQVASHEFAEMVTDPQINAWLGTKDKENGDICNGQPGTISVGKRTWTVQRMYSRTNDVNGGPAACQLAPPRPLPIIGLPNGPTAKGDRMLPGQVLHGGDSITSADGRFLLVYQSDGNLVLYRLLDQAATWASGTDGQPVGVCIMQSDGNLVVYNLGGTAVWASGTDGHPGSFVIAQTDGNLVVYQPDNVAIWATNTEQPTPPNGPKAKGDRMLPGQVLHPGDSITSVDGRFRFVYQGDGNLVLYRLTDGAATWASGTNGTSAAVCIMQTDGNLVVYDAAGAAAWASGTEGHPGSLVIAQSDGNVVVYQPENVAIWATNTAQPTLPNGPKAKGDRMLPGQVLHGGDSIISGDGRFRLVYQGDGNLVLYRLADGAPLWSSGTNGRSVAACIMQTDGNLVVYDAAGAAAWASGTDGHGGSLVIAQSDGNVVIYQPGNVAIWATNTVQ
ncbi:MAG: hypothetical protein ACR2KV_12545 [Solirubrobacteraceae bacterium]